MQKVEIVALGNSCSEFLMAKIRSESFNEVWAINSIASAIFHDKVFMMDPPSRFLDGKFAGKQTNAMKERLITKLEIPIFSCVLDDRCPDVVEYPLQDGTALTPPPQTPAPQPSLPQPVIKTYILQNQEEHVASFG